MTQAATLQVSPDTVPYLLKLADLSGAVDEEGEISKDAVTEALNKVLADIPALKQTKEQAKGFIRLAGADRTGKAQNWKNDSAAGLDCRRKSKKGLI